MPPPFHKGPKRTFEARRTYSTNPRFDSISPSSDRLAGGASVTITGIGFRNAADGTAPSVRFGGVAATSVVVVSTTSITCIVPAAAAAGPVDVTGIFGSYTTTLLAGFVYVESAIEQVTPAFGTTAGGVAVVILGYNFVTGSTITFGGVPATSVAFIDASHYACVTPAHAFGHVDVVVTEPGGASATLRSGFRFTLRVRGNDIRRQPGISIQEGLDRLPYTCTFTIDGESHAPIGGDELLITDEQDGDRILYAGHVDFVEQAFEEQIDQLVWNGSAINTWMFNKRRPYGTYTNVSASEVVKDLVARYAPAFTTTFVQTNLALVTVSFDGTQDLATCVGDVARLIGSGHFYLNRYDLHFFHMQPQLKPYVPISLGPGSACVLAAGPAMPNTASFTSGYWYARVGFLYSNGVESLLGPASNVFGMTGLLQMAFSALPVGSDPGGGVTCVGRIVYLQRGLNFLQPAFKIHDNVTTSLNWYPGKLTTGAVENVEGTVSSITVAPNTIPPPPLLGAPAVSAARPNPNGQNGFLLAPGQNPPGNWFISVAAAYQDGSISQPSAEAGPIFIGQDGVDDGSLSTSEGFLFSGFPLAPSINGVQPIVYVVYGRLHEMLTGDPGQFPVVRSFPAGANATGYLITNPHDIAQEIGALNYALISELTGTTFTPNDPASFGDRPVLNPSDTRPTLTWPNPDGPYLENGDPPLDIDDDNQDLIRDPQVTKSEDISQLRNRITVYGASTTLIEDAVIGAQTLTLADPTVFTSLGGQIIIEGYLAKYFSLGATPGAGQMLLTKPLTAAFPSGTRVTYYLQIEDVASQKRRAAVELDANGAPTDGIHEYTINDTSLATPQQMYLAAYAQLEMFSDPIYTVKYATRDFRSHPGQTVHWDLTNPPVNGDFLIQDVTIDQVHDESDQLSPRYVVTATSARFALEDFILRAIEMPSVSSGAVSATGIVSGALDQGDTAISSAVSGTTRTLSVTLDASYLINSTSSPVVLIPAVAGSVIVPIQWMAQTLKTAGNGWVNGGTSMSLVYDGQPLNILTAGPIGLGLNATALSSVYGTSICWTGGLFSSGAGSLATVGKAVCIRTGANITSAGSPSQGTVRVFISYMIVPATATNPVLF